jgi:hypothetical protein
MRSRYKNRKLFVARLSCFWLREILLDHLKKKIFPAEKKMEGMNGPDPLITVPLKSLFLAA